METHSSSGNLTQNAEEPRAIQFITLNNGKFDISPQAETFFEKLQTQIESQKEFCGLGIISVVGKYRTGKSYFINKVLLNKKSKSTGFEVGPTVNACTKGLWVWDRLIDATDKLGRPIKVLVIDSEGLNSTEVDSNYDNRVFMFCLLLSSLFIYNSMGAIDENALQTINLILNLALKIKLKGGSNRASEAEIRSAFPDFLWVLRDAFLSQEDLKGRKLTSGEYLESALKKQSGMSMNAKNKNRIRMQIKKFFPERDCVRFVRPVEDESKLRSLNTLDDRCLRSQFLSQVKSTRNKIFGSLKTKSYQGELLSPKLILDLARSYLTAINEHQELNIESAWKYVIRQQAGKGKIRSEELLNKLVSSVNNLLAGQGTGLQVQEGTSPIEARVLQQIERLACLAVGGVDWGEWKANVRELLREEFRRFCIKGKGDYESIEQSILVSAEPKLIMLEKSVSNTTKNKIRKKLRQEIDKVSVAASNGELDDSQLENEIRLILIKYVDSEISQRFFSTLKQREGTDLNGISVLEALERLVEYEEGREILTKVKFLDELLDKDSEYMKLRDYLKDKKAALVIQIMEAHRAEAKRKEAELIRLCEERLEDQRTQIANKGELAEQEEQKLKEKVGEMEHELERRNDRISELENELQTERSKMQHLVKSNERKQQESVPSQELDKLRDEIAEERKRRLAAEKRVLDTKEETKRLNIMKEMLENQVSNLQSTKRDFKGVFEDFMLKMKLDKEDSRVLDSNRDVEKRLSTAVAQLTDRNTRLEEKLEKLNNYKTMVKHAASFECKLCYEQILDSEFFDHVLNCATGRSKILGRSTRASRRHSTISIGNQKTPLSTSQPRFRPENSGLDASLADIERGFYETGEMPGDFGLMKGFDQSREGVHYQRGQGFNALEGRRRGSGRSARKTGTRGERRFADRSLQNFRNASLTRAGPRNENLGVKGSRSIRSIRRPKVEDPEPAVSMLHQRKIEKYLLEKIIPSEVSVEIEKTRVKLENKSSKKSSGDSTFIFYEVKVFFGDLESHVIYRKLLDFCSLSKRMEASFERQGRSLEFIEDFKATVQRMLKNRTQIESRKRILEQFLCEMVQLEAGKKSPLFFRFLGLERLSKLQKQSESVLISNAAVNSRSNRNASAQGGRKASINGSYLDNTNISGVNSSMQQIPGRNDRAYPRNGGRSHASRKRLEVENHQNYKSYNQQQQRNDHMGGYIQPHPQQQAIMGGEDQETYARPQNRQKMLYNPHKNIKPTQMDLERSQKWAQSYQKPGRRRRSNRKPQKNSARKNNYDHQYDYPTNRNEKVEGRRKARPKSFKANGEQQRAMYGRRDLATEKHINEGYGYDGQEISENSRLQEDLHSNYNTVKSRSNRMTAKLEDEDEQGYFNRLAQKKEQVVENSNILYSRFEDDPINLKNEPKFQETDNNEPQRDSQNQNFYENSESSGSDTDSDKDIPVDALLESKENFALHENAKAAEDPYYQSGQPARNTQNYDIEGYRATLDENSVDSQEKEDFEKLKESSRQLRGINSLTQKMLRSSQKSLKSGKFGSRLYHQRQRGQTEAHPY